MDDDVFGGEDDGPKDIDEVREHLEQNENQPDEGPKVEDSKKEEKKEEKNNDDEKAPDEEDIFNMIRDNDQKKEKIFPEGKEFNKLECYFKKIKIPSKKRTENVPEDQLKNLNESYGIFFCYQTNPATKCKCEPEKLICPNCMKNTQKIYGLKSHYLINSMGRVCTYKKGKIFCKGKFSKIEDDYYKTNNIKYCYNYVCGHSGQCESCQNLTEKMENYFDPNLMKKLKERDNGLN